MKNVNTKTVLIMVTFIAIFFLGGKAVIAISDRFQKEICIDKVCIVKPKGWLPAIVERDEGKFLLNVVNINKIMQLMEDDEDGIESLSFDDGEDQKNYSSLILLSKDSKSIYIKRHKFIPNKKTEQYYRKFEHLSKIYYVKKTNYPGAIVIYYPKNELYITMPSLDKDLLDEICSYGK